MYIFPRFGILSQEKSGKPDPIKKNAAAAVAEGSTLYK
jgi:hypothetical protein